MLHLHSRSSQKPSLWNSWTTIMTGCNFFPDLPYCKDENGFGPSIGGVHSAECRADLTSCRSGHEMIKCPGTGTDDKAKWYCQQCGDLSFQPNDNRYGDKCRLRKPCERRFMSYADYGSTTRDAICKCLPGYHFESTDQRSCVANSECSKGYGQTQYGTCDKCIVGSTYSDVSDTQQTCQIVTNCEKQFRCTIKRSNGTGDNVCSVYTVKDPSKDCDHPPSLHEKSPNQSALTEGAIVGIVLGVVVLIVAVLFLLLFLLYRRRRSNNTSGHVIDTDQLDRLSSQITERATREEPYRRKVMTAAIREIEDNINKQIWSLPQELFRNHFQDAKYELVVEKYKDKDHKYAINGYMQDWREWREDAGDAVSELFTCLKKVKREDIIYKICSKFREAYPEVVIDAETQLENGVVSRRSKRQNEEGILDILFPCCSAQSSSTNDCEETEQVKFMLDDSKEAASTPKTLEFEPNEKGNNSNDNGAMTPQEAGNVYRDHPVPSAPVLDETGNIHIIIPMNRSVSYPVQASS